MDFLGKTRRRGLSYYEFIIITVIVMFLTFQIIGTVTFIPSDEMAVVSETNETKELARLKIKDTYKKDGMRYYIFRSDISEDREFILSEEEWNKYIGYGNDAVDCNVYTLTMQGNIGTIKGFPNPSYTKQVYGIDDSEMTDGLDDGARINIIVEATDDRTLYKQTFDAYGRILIKRYSFVGEKDFSEKEIEEVKSQFELKAKELKFYIESKI